MTLNRRAFCVSIAGVAGHVALGRPAWAGHAANSAPGLGVTTEAPHAEHILFGADYYPDQTPEAKWDTDAAAMAAAGIANVRIAEFAWSLMEPREGTYSFEWLQRAIAVLDKHGIAVILGTPSAAPPPWLSAKYPEILLVNEHGVTLVPGTRRFTCPSNKTYRRLSNEIATKMAETFASTAGVIGWQIDNELTLGAFARCYCPACRTGFQDWVKAKYGSLNAVNAAWGTVFWSNVYTDWAQIPVPLPSGAPPNPGFALDYDRYQSVANVEFLREQLAVLRRLCPKQWITTNNVGLTDTIDMRDLYRDLDFASTDNYPGVFEAFAGDAAPAIPPEAVASVVAFSHDFTRSMKGGKPFLVMEEQAGKAGQATFAAQPFPGQLRLWSYQAVAHGAMGINYFRWDTARSGAEEYWHGMLDHDGRESLGFAEIRQTIRELKSLGPAGLHAGYEAEIALLYDYDADWALAIQPGQPKLKYTTELMTWYACMAATHAGIDVVDGTGDLRRYKIVCAPLQYVLAAKQAERIREFVQDGGIFVSGFRLGVKDEESRIVGTPLPGLLRDVMGVEVFDYQPIYSATQGVKFSGMLAGPDAVCRLWADMLQPDPGTEVLATYTGSDAGKAAITLHTFGKGKAIYLGAHLEGADLGRVLYTLIAANGVGSKTPLPRGVEMTVRKDGATQWTYLLNHTGAAVTVPMKTPTRDAITGTDQKADIELEAYGARILMTR